MVLLEIIPNGLSHNQIVKANERFVKSIDVLLKRLFTFCHCYRRKSSIFLGTTLVFLVNVFLIFSLVAPFLSRLILVIPLLGISLVIFTFYFCPTTNCFDLHQIVLMFDLMCPFMSFSFPSNQAEARCQEEEDEKMCN